MIGSTMCFMTDSYDEQQLSHYAANFGRFMSDIWEGGQVYKQVGVNEFDSFPAEYLLSTSD